MIKNVSRRFASLVIFAVLLVTMVMPLVSNASDATDVINDYEITADVNEDATVNLKYHIEWTVLDSDELGPLSWVNIGLPNSKVMEYSADSSNIKSIDISGNYAEIYFKKDYYEGEKVSFDFTIVQDYMYSMNELEDGQTLYYFTPGWFDSIDVEKLVMRWNSEKALSWDGPGECLIKDGYCTWTSSMPAGDTVSFKMSYPNDAYSFDESKDYSDEYDNWNGDWDNDYGFIDFGAGIIALFLLVVAPIAIIKSIISGLYSLASGFVGEKTKTKITRTKIVYYPNCPSCGAPRTEGKDKCEYCGRSMIKEEEVLKEEPVDDKDQEAYRYKKKGTFRYSDSPDTYVRVNVIPVPIHSSSGHSSRHSGGGGHRSSSSCAHSSCACASCACACACACAGGGRAGCTAKDFYRTNLKLKQLELKKKHR